MSTTFPPREPGRHGWAQLLTLVGAVRRLAFDRTLPPSEAMGRIRDLSLATTITRGHIWSVRLTRRLAACEHFAARANQGEITPNDFPDHSRGHHGAYARRVRRWG